jgi:hypothetical protein
MNPENLPVEVFRLQRDELRAELLPLLRGRVFHVTTAEAWRKIEATGVVLANTDGSLGFSFDFSEVSALRNNGIVSLCDLRNLKEEKLDQALSNYYFLHPRSSSSEGPVFLLLSRDAESSVIPPRYVAKMFPIGGYYVAHLEAGMRDQIPLNLLDRVIAVQILEAEISGPGGEHLRALLVVNRRPRD